MTPLWFWLSWEPTRQPTDHAVLHCWVSKLELIITSLVRDATLSLGQFQRRLKTSLFCLACGRDFLAHSWPSRLYKCTNWTELRLKPVICWSYKSGAKIAMLWSCTSVWYLLLHDADRAMLKRVCFWSMYCSSRSCWIDNNSENNYWTQHWSWVMLFLHHRVQPLWVHFSCACTRCNWTTLRFKSITLWKLQIIENENVIPIHTISVIIVRKITNSISLWQCCWNFCCSHRFSALYVLFFQRRNIFCHFVICSKETEINEAVLFRLD